MCECVSVHACTLCVSMCDCACMCFKRVCVGVHPVTTMSLPGLDLSVPRGSGRAAPLSDSAAGSRSSPRRQEALIRTVEPQKCVLKMIDNRKEVPFHHSGVIGNSFIYNSAANSIYRKHFTDLCPKLQIKMTIIACCLGRDNMKNRNLSFVDANLDILGANEMC